MKQFLIWTLFISANCIATVAVQAQDKQQVKRYEGELSADKPKIIFKSNLTAGFLYTFELESKAFDPYLELRDAKGVLLSEDDDGGNGFDARLLFAPKDSGAYQLVARSFGNGKGKFSLSIRAEKTVFVARDALTNDDPIDRIRKNSRHKVHTATLQAGMEYTIDLLGSGFDPFLRIEDEKKKVLAENDDGGSGINARIVFRPAKAGDYRFIATAFGSGTGSYVLVMTAQKATGKKKKK